MKQKQFIHVERQSLRKMYIHNNYCNYCLCGKSVISSSVFISHLSTLESTYYCYLILNHLEENDEKNQRRIDVLVRDFEKRKLKSTRIRANTNIDALMASVVASANSAKSTDEVRNELSDCDEPSIEIDESKLEQPDRTPCKTSPVTGGDRLVPFDNPQIKMCPIDDKCLVPSEIDQRIVQLPRNQLVVQMESTVKKNFDELQSIIQQLQGDEAVDRPNLLESLMQEQASLLLTKRVENYQTKEHHLSFAKKIDVTANDLNNLLTKYGISNRLRIEKAEISLNLVMKDELGLNVDQSLTSATYHAIDYSPSDTFNGSYETSAELDAKPNLANSNSAAHSNSVYYDCPDTNRHKGSNGTDHLASYPPATNSSDNTQPGHQIASTNHQFDSNRNGHMTNGSNHFDLDGLEDVSDGDVSSSEEMAIEPVKPPRPPKEKPVVKKCPLDESLSNISQRKLLNFKIPKKPQVNSFGHFNSSPENDRSNDRHWSNGDSRSSPLKDHYKSSSSSSYYRHY